MKRISLRLRLMSKLESIGKLLTILILIFVTVSSMIQLVSQPSGSESTSSSAFPSDPNVQWFVRTGTTIKCPLETDESFVYLVTSSESDATAESEGTVLTISKKTGEIKYQYDIGEKGEYIARDVSSIKVYEDRLFICSNNNGLVCLNKTTFLPIWSQPYNNVNPITISQNRIFFTRSGRSLYCLDLETGNELWSYPVSTTNCVPAIYEDTVFGADFDKIFILKINTGNEVWSDNLLRTNQVEAISSPIIHDNKLVVTTSDYNLHVYSILGESTAQLTVGNELWSLEGRKLYPHFCQPVVYGDKLFVCYNNNLNAFDLGLGTSLWTLDLNCEKVILTGDKLVVTGDTTVYAVDPESGDTLWELDLVDQDLDDGPVVGSLNSGYILVDNNSVFVTDENGWIYKLSDSTSGDEDDADIHWPLSICINLFIIIIIITVIYFILRWKLKSK
jgi:outer membrane protein assembly factor BamB